jgi:hypothetical protein
MLIFSVGGQTPNEDEANLESSIALTEPKAEKIASALAAAPVFDVDGHDEAAAGRCCHSS